jgi:hypothetical protein
LAFLHPNTVLVHHFSQFGIFFNEMPEFMAAGVKEVWKWSLSAHFSVRQELGSMYLGHCL